MKRKEDIQKLKQIGFSKIDKKVFFANYRGYKCHLSHHLVSIGLKPCIKIAIQFNLDSRNKLDYLAKKYGAINVKWYLDAVEYYSSYNFFPPKYDEIKKRLDELIDILNLEIGETPG